jgi:hypothetical protein
MQKHLMHHQFFLYEMLSPRLLMILAKCPINICEYHKTSSWCVMATKPTTTPIQAPIADNLCPRILSRNTQAIPAAAV